MDRRWKWVVVLSLLAMVVWACTKGEDETSPEQETRESAPTGQNSDATRNASEQQVSVDKSAENGMPEDDLDKGEGVYRQSCASCHDQGIAGAPRLTDTADWQERLQKGMETLNDNAINGYQGETGVMPPKGGNPSLSDDEVEAAVAYMIAEATE